MVILMKIKLKVQLNTARRHERSDIIILGSYYLLTEKECTGSGGKTTTKGCMEIINKLPILNIIMKGNRYILLKNK